MTTAAKRKSLANSVTTTPRQETMAKGPRQTAEAQGRTPRHADTQAGSLRRRSIPCPSKQLVRLGRLKASSSVARKRLGPTSTLDGSAALPLNDITGPPGQPTEHEVPSSRTRPRRQVKYDQEAVQATPAPFWVGREVGLRACGAALRSLPTDLGDLQTGKQVEAVCNLLWLSGKHA